MAHETKVAEIISQFPWGFYIVEDMRPQLTSMVEKYLEADMFKQANEAYYDFMQVYYAKELKETDKELRRQITHWLVYSVDCWREDLRKAWLDIHGPRHTREEVMQIAADWWCERIFGTCLQDNGDDTPEGRFGMSMATRLKSNAMNHQSTAVRTKTHTLIMEYYGRIYDDPKSYERGLDVDYAPCANLRTILLNAGVDEKDIDSIVPFKTGLALRDFDKSLVGTAGYRNFVDL